MLRAPGYAALAVAVALYRYSPAVAMCVWAAAVVWLVILDVFRPRGVDTVGPRHSASLAPIPAPRVAADPVREVQPR